MIEERRVCYTEVKTAGERSGRNFYPAGSLELRLFLFEDRDGTLNAVPILVNHPFQDAAVILVPHFPAGSNVPNRETTDLQVMTKSGAVHGSVEGEGRIFTQVPVGRM